LVVRKGLPPVRSYQSTGDLLDWCLSGHCNFGRGWRTRSRRDSCCRGGMTVTRKRNISVSTGASAAARRCGCCSVRSRRSLFVLYSRPEITDVKQAQGQESRRVEHWLGVNRRLAFDQETSTMPHRRDAVSVLRQERKARSSPRSPQPSYSGVSSDTCSG
jgi:hypothetical protein